MFHLKLGLFAFSAVLLLGQLFHISAFRKGVLVLLGLMLLAGVIGAGVGIGVMYSGNRHSMRRLDFAMAAAPAALVCLGVLCLVVLGAVL